MDSGNVWRSTAENGWGNIAIINMPAHTILKVYLGSKFLDLYIQAYVEGEKNATFHIYTNDGFREAKFLDRHFG